MKKITSFILAIIIFNGLSGQTEETGPRMIIKTNFLPTIWSQIPGCGEYRLVYEQALPLSKSAFLVGLSYNSTPLLLARLFSDAKISGVRFQAQYKHYLSKGKYAPSGFYIGPHFSYNYAKLENSAVLGEYIQATYMNFNLLMGYQIIADDVFALDFFSGLGYKSNTFSSQDSGQNTGFVEPQSFDLMSGGKFTFGFNFGVAF